MDFSESDGQDYRLYSDEHNFISKLCYVNKENALIWIRISIRFFIHYHPIA